MEAKEDASILKDIQEKYVPFLKKLISFLEKNKKASTDSVNKLRSIHTVFTTASPVEQIEVFVANQKKLEKWYKSTQKDKESDKESVKSLKRPLVAEDSDSSQGALDGNAKKSKVSSTFVVTTVKASVIPQNIESTLKPLNNDSSKPTNSNQTHQSLANNSPLGAVSDGTESSPVCYQCASCRYSSCNEHDFMKHIRTEHRSDLSMWCKSCGKCFSNAGVLINHIKEGACLEEEMLFKCGVKDCPFQTESGQTFVHHLRHCHKGSPFIFCIHCQKIFTLPHCLILHMQDECVYKEKNRKSGASTDEPHPPNKPPKPTPIKTVTPQPAKLPAVQMPTISSVASAVKDVQFKQTPSTVPKATRCRGKGGRGRGRGRRTAGKADSSESDVDDPVWDQLLPSEDSEKVGMRRSGRWAKRISEVTNAEPRQKTTLSLSEIKDRGDILKCPCCDFMAAFKSVLQDHYIAQHKALKKNTCLVCNLKFETTALFVAHFDDHASGKLDHVGLSSLSKDSNISHSGETEKSLQSDKCALVLSENGSTLEQFDVSLTKELLNSLVLKISDDMIINPTSVKTVKVPYQGGMKGRKINKILVFEDFKSVKVLDVMRCKEKISHFYKCVWYDCEFTSHNWATFTKHFDIEHPTKKKYYCTYCMKECGNPNSLVNHMVLEHGNRRFQCSSCFYRSVSKIHIQVHIHLSHSSNTAGMYECKEPDVPPGISIIGFLDEPSKFVWPYVCSERECNFQTFHPDEFIEHNKNHHRNAPFYYCHFCKVDFVEVEKLLIHYRFHGLNDFQCYYCNHGYDKQEEILEHLINFHVDQPLRAFRRGKDYSSVPAKSELSSCCESNPVTQHSTRSNCSLGDNGIDFEKLLYDVVGKTYYPKYLNKILTDFTCGVPWCRERFESISFYCDHLKEVHESLTFSCPHCPSVLDTWMEFKDHLLCHGPELYACGSVACDFYHWNKCSVEKHLENHQQASINSVIIRQVSLDSADCKSALTDINLLSDIRLVSGQEEAYQCFFCKYKCKNRKILKNHLYKEMGYKRFSCNICAKKLVSQEDVFDHCKSLHSKTVECSIKSNSVVEVYVKNIINQVIKSPDTENMCCSVCSKKFTVFTQWQRHLTLCVQNQYQPFDCDYCDTSVSDLKILKFHVDFNHSTQSVSYKEVSSEVVENKIGEKLMEARLAYLSSIPRTENNEENSQAFLKSYVCSACCYESNHKYKTQTHIESVHSDVNACVKKLLRKNVEQITPEADGSSNDSTKLVPKSSKCYQCGFCRKKFSSLDEIRRHAETQHSMSDKMEYSCNYYPDSNCSFEIDDKELYECAYCKSGKQNLFNLKKHSDLMHASIPFKVKCLVGNLKEFPSSVLSCNYCFKRLNGLQILKQHTTAEHPSLPVKPLGGYSEGTSKNKRCEEPTCSSLRKIRFSTEAFVCTHCGAAFSKKNELVTHSRKIHRRLEISFYRALDNLALDYYKCEFCKFVSEAKYMNSHLKSKHKMRVTCVHCNKRFEFATKLKEHHDVCHQGLPVQYVQETIGENDVSKQIFLSSDSSSIPKIDLSEIYVYLPEQSTKITVLDYSKTCNIFPKILLNRCILGI